MSHLRNVYKFLVLEHYHTFLHVINHKLFTDKIQLLDWITWQMQSLSSLTKMPHAFDSSICVWYGVVQFLWLPVSLVSKYWG